MADLPSSIAAVDALKTLQRVLIKGNETGGNNLIVSPSDLVQGMDNPQGSLLHLRGGDSQSGGNSGANVRIEGGAGDTTGDGGNLVVRGGVHGGSGTNGFVQITNNGGADTAPIYSLISEGANGATLHVFVGDQDPNVGTVPSLSAGDIYYRNEGSTYRSTAAGTGNWVIQSGVIRALDSRSSPHTTPSAASGGGTAEGTIAVGTANGTMLYLLLSSAATVNPVDVEFFSDSGRNFSIYLNSAVDLSAPVTVRNPVFLMSDAGADLESNSIYYRITNNGGSNSTFDISMIVEGL